MRRRDLHLLLAGNGGPLTLAGGLMVASTVAAATAVVLGGRVVDALADGTDARRLAWAALAIGVTGPLSWLASDLVIARVATRIAVRLRGAMVRHTLSLPVGFFTDRSVGEITDRISTDVDTIATGIVNQVKPIVNGVIGAAIALAMSTVIDLRIAVLFVPTGVLIGWSGWWSGRRVAERSRAVQSEWAEAAGTAEEAFEARDDLRQALGRGLVMRRWAEHIERLWQRISDLARARNLLSLSTIGWLRLFQIVVLVVGASLAIDGELRGGEVWAAFGLVTLFARRTEEVLNNLPKVSEFVAASQRIAELLDEAAEPSTTVEARPGAVDWRGAVSVDIDGLTYAYGDGPPVLHDVSVTVRPGRSLALVGRTGSGKTTIARLVNRMVDVPAGHVLIDGVDVCAIPVAELRSNVGVVSQRVELLRASLRDNVTLFDPDIAESAIRAAFEHLELSRWLADLPAGLDTVVGEDGLTLSAGEEQLLAFARLLVRNPAIVVLDEATARLDPGTERLLQAATERLLAGRTSIIIAHRLSTVRNADDVVVLEEGRVAEAGQRHQLLDDSDSVFAALVQAAGGIDVAEVVETHRRRRVDLDEAARQPAAPVDERLRLGPHRTTLRLMTRHLRYFLPGTLGWLIFFVSPAFAAWAWLDLLPELRPGGDASGPIRVFVGAALVGLAGKMLGERVFSKWWMISNATLRSNLLAAQLHPTDSRTGRRSVSPGDAVSRMWDTNDLVNYADHYLDLGLSVLFVLTITVLTGNWGTVPWLVAPILLPAAIAGGLRPKIDRVAREHARLRGTWSGRVAEVCAAATTIKGFGGEPHVIDHVDTLTRQRQGAALRQRYLEVAVYSSVFLTAETGARLVLVLAATAAATGGAGPEPAYAVAVAEAIAHMPLAGIVTCMLIQESPMIRAKLRRMERLLPTDDFDLTKPPTDLSLPPSEAIPVPTIGPRHDRLEHVALRDGSVVFPDGTVALEDVTLDVARGQLVIVTGPIASGKSTLLRVFAGLVAPTQGELTWNDAGVDDPSVFMRPPNCAFVAQVPRLLSGTVDENVSLDRDVDVRAAIRLAELSGDLDRFGGTDTRVGHRGLRLSGGQTQRLAAARALAATEELLVLDDLSSALDVVTERQLWENLRLAGRTVVATSYKRSALELADQILVLRGGRVASRGRLVEVEAEFGHLFA